MRLQVRFMNDPTIDNFIPATIDSLDLKLVTIFDPFIIQRTFFLGVDRTCYVSHIAGKEGSLRILPIYLDHIFFPTLTVSESMF